MLRSSTRPITPTGNWPAGLQTSRQGLVLLFNPDTGWWDTISPLRSWQTGDPELGTTVAQFADKGLPVVLVLNWARQVDVQDTGFAEAAADTFFAALVGLDQKAGALDPSYHRTVTQDDGSVKLGSGPLLEAPLHFIGHSRGVAVASEMIQRVGTWCTGTGSIQLTSLDALAEFPGHGGKSLSIFRQKAGDADKFAGADVPWYQVAAPDAVGELGLFDSISEGVGEGWYYSEMGGGATQRSTVYSGSRAALTDDNSTVHDGDGVISTVFNGGFEQGTSNLDPTSRLGRKVPGPGPVALGLVDVHGLFVNIDLFRAMLPWIFDHAGNDHLEASGRSARLYNCDQSITATGFGRVKAVSSQGGVDTRRVEALDYLLETIGPWFDL